MTRRRRIRVIAIVLVVTLVGSLLAAGLFAGGQEAAAEPCAEVETPAAPAPRLEPYADPPGMVIDPGAELSATIATTCGELTLELFAEDAPRTVNNFVFLARDDYYRGVPFHRVRPGFVVQGGDPTGTGTGCVDEACETRLPGYSFEDELARARELVDEHGGYPRGTVAMANAGPDTNGSQFFIVQGDVVSLPPDFSVFGRVTSGMEVVDDIAAGETGDRLTDPEHILDVTITGPGTTATPEEGTS